MKLNVRLALNRHKGDLERGFEKPQNRISSFSAVIMTK
jgi:hypothetical protein